jgi:SAM-dependent methyltransferase
MAILTGIARLLIEEHMRRPFTGHLLQLGRQEILFKRDDLARIMRTCGMPAERLKPGGQDLDDIAFFSIFDFDSISAADVSVEMTAEVVHDLNSADVSPAHRGRFDVIFDGGTMEHVFHAPNLFAAIHALLAENGRIVHNTPASNSIDHGFYSFSPCLYHEYYKTNGYRIETAYLLDYGSRYLPIRMTAYNYDPPLRRSWLDMRRPSHVHYNFFVARKQLGATFGRVPQQSFYEAIWTEASGGATQAAQDMRVGLADRLISIVKASPGVDRFVRRYGLPLLRLHDTWSARRALQRVARRIT